MKPLTKNNFLVVLIPLLLPLSAYAQDKGVAYVSNQQGAVTVIDLKTMGKKADLGIEAKGPRGIGVTADGQWLVTANKDDGNLSVIDTGNGNLVKQIAIGKNPEFVRVLGNMAYVTFEPGVFTIPQAGAVKSTDDEDKVPGHIAVVDLIAGRIVVDITGKPETEGVEISSDAQRLIVTNESDNSISVFDIHSGKLLNNISVAKYGERPRGIKLSPDGHRYVVTMEFSAKMLVLDDAFKLVKEVATGKAPYGVAFDSEGKRVFVASNKDKLLQVFDAKTWEKLKDIPSGERCWHFTFTPDNQQLLLACGKSNEILVIDANRLEVTGRISNSGMPWGIVTYPKSMGSLDRP